MMIYVQSLSPEDISSVQLSYREHKDNACVKKDFQWVRGKKEMHQSGFYWPNAHVFLFSLLRKKDLDCRFFNINSSFLEKNEKINQVFQHMQNRICPSLLTTYY